jgi:hypothetical protein
MRDAKSDGGKNTKKKLQGGNSIVGHFLCFWGIFGNFYVKWIFVKKGDCWMGAVASL